MPQALWILVMKYNLSTVHFSVYIHLTLSDNYFGFQKWLADSLFSSMPFISFYSADDFISIHYQTNSQYGNVGGFDVDKPIILILSPMFFDIRWLDNHCGDPRLYQNYNLIALDMRCSGETVSRPSPRHDTWVEAADVALCLLVCHILTWSWPNPHYSTDVAVTTLSRHGSWANLSLRCTTVRSSVRW